MRPTYETESDRQHEQQVIDLLCGKWGCEATKNPAFYPSDWALSQDGEVKALVEIKFRKKSYPTYIIGLHKYTNLLIGAASGIKHLLVISWPEGGKRVVKYAEIVGGMHSRFIKGGRKDRGDWQDQEPMAEIGMDKFKLVGEL